MRKLMQAVGFKQVPSIMYEDNNAAVTLSKANHLMKGMRHMESL